MVRSVSRGFEVRLSMTVEMLESSCRRHHPCKRGIWWVLRERMVRIVRMDRMVGVVRMVGIVLNLIHHGMVTDLLVMETIND